MKKTYIHPTSVVVKITMKHQLLNASDPILNILTGNVAADEVESRRGSSWDDEEEEDD